MQGLSDPFEAARYHSLVIDREGFPEDALEVTAWTEDGTVMGVRHRQYPHIQVLLHDSHIATASAVAGLLPSCQSVAC